MTKNQPITSLSNASTREELRRKSHPIIFNGEMVRAIIGGRKTQTRRVMKPQPGQMAGADYVDGVWYAEDEYGDSYCCACPYGGPGDRLWVRETWGALYPDVDPVPLKECAVVYRADSPHEKYPGGWPQDEARGNPDAPKWMPSIHMPRWASRITLDVVKAFPQRLQDITEDQAAAEGIERHAGPYILDFARLWNQSNGTRKGCAWNDNPWVWVVEFNPMPPAGGSGCR